MKLCGLNKTTLLDFPGLVGITVFLGGCNLRCPFCQNGGLVLHAQEEPEISQEEFFTFLKRRQGISDGVCVSGGEPTLAPELPQFLEQIKSLGYQVKLDTNGTRPAVLADLLSHHLVDYIAMDIKTSPTHYAKVAGIPDPDLSAIRESADLLMTAAPVYEFRTTEVRELHSEENFREIADWLAGASQYFLQQFRDSDNVITPGFHSPSRPEMEHFQQILQTTIPAVSIRGMD